MDWKEEANTLKHKVLTIAFAFQSMQPMWKIIINKKLKKDFQFIFFSIFYLHKSYSEQFTLISNPGHFRRVQRRYQKAMKAFSNRRCEEFLFKQNDVIITVNTSKVI